MRSNALLLEQVTLAEEILENGPGDGRAYRLAGVVLALHGEIGGGGAMPDAWRPNAPSSLPPPVPGVPDDWPDLDLLDASWDAPAEEPETELDELDFIEEVIVIPPMKSLHPLILVY